MTEGESAIGEINKSAEPALRKMKTWDWRDR